jgi:hypothetical protein
MGIVMERIGKKFLYADILGESWREFNKFGQGGGSKRLNFCCCLLITGYKNFFIVAKDHPGLLFQP